MKLPYTSLQFAARHGEEGGVLAAELSGMPVLCCSLHSQVAPACAGLGEGLEVAYVQLPGGALPLPLSDTVRALHERGLLTTTVSAGACFGGDIECVGVESALAWAAGSGYRAVVCAMAPGSSAPAPGSGTEAWRRRKRSTPARLSAARRCWRRECRAQTSASGTAGSRITRRRCSGSAPREWSSHGRRAWRRRTGSSPGERSTSTGGKTPRGPAALAHGPRPDEEPWFFAAAFAAGRLVRSLVSCTVARRRDPVAFTSARWPPTSSPLRA